jgi:threonine dehydratase
VAVGAVLHGRTRPFPTPAVVIVSGGNIDADRLARIMESCPADARSTDA